MPKRKHSFFSGRCSLNQEQHIQKRSHNQLSDVRENGGGRPLRQQSLQIGKFLPKSLVFVIIIIKISIIIIIATIIIIGIFLSSTLCCAIHINVILPDQKPETCGGKPATPVSCPGVILCRGARNRRKSRVVCRDSQITRARTMARYVWLRGIVWHWAPL